jgi:hypothetical protein
MHRLTPQFMAENSRISGCQSHGLEAFRDWLREGLLGHGVLALPAYRRLGWKGLYLIFCGWPLRSLIWPVHVRCYGELRSREQVINFLGNFCDGELLNPEVEEHLACTPRCRVVDVGVNLGLTAAYWFALQPSARVVGFDMMEEALSAATAALAVSHPWVDWRPVRGVVTDAPGEVPLRYAQPPQFGWRPSGPADSPGTKQHPRCVAGSRRCRWRTNPLTWSRSTWRATGRRCWPERRARSSARPTSWLNSIPRLSWSAAPATCSGPAWTL